MIYRKNNSSLELGRALEGLLIAARVAEYQIGKSLDLDFGAANAEYEDVTELCDALDKLSKAIQLAEKAVDIRS